MIIHQPRLAWNAARAFVTACESGDEFAWLSVRIGALLGPAYAEALTATRQHLLRPSRLDARSVESGAWRARIDDLLRRQPELAEPLTQLVATTSGRASRPYWPVN